VFNSLLASKLNGCELLTRQVVISRSSKGIRLYVLLLFYLGILILFFLFFVWIRLKTIQYGYLISQETEYHQKLLIYNKQLRIEIATLRSPARIEAIAIKELGMKMPNPDQIIIVK